MKLKKIASLAMAGALAVSMFAGCAKTNGNTPNPNPAPVETSGMSTAVEERLSVKGLGDYITFEDDTDLDADLEYAVEYVGVREIIDGFVNVNDLLIPVESPDFVDVLEDEVGVTSFSTGLGTKQDNVYEIGLNETLVAAEAAAGKATEMDDAVAVQSYVISGQIGDRAVQQKIADAVSKYVDDYLYTVVSNNAQNFAGGNWNYEYTVSVSTCTVDTHSVVVENNFGKLDGIIGAENPDVTYVAVQVVRTATHQ